MERGRQKTIDTRFLEKAEFGGARRRSSSNKTRKARKSKRSSTRKN
jgi:hypothetical protein